MSARIAAHSLAEVWEKSLSLFDLQKEAVRFTSERGPCIEIGDVLLEASDGSGNQNPSSVYPTVLRPLVHSYSEGFISSRIGPTVSERLYMWRTGDLTPLDQVDRAVERLQAMPHSRYNIIGLWDPTKDPNLPNPVSPLLINLRARHGRLNGTLIARTVDAWLGAFPMFLGFARFLSHVGTRSALQVGSATFHILSYHVYEMDLPVVRGAAARFASHES